MKAAFIKNYSNDEPIQVGELLKPQVGPYEILIQIKAASINPIDFKLKAGLLKFLRKNTFPLILGHDLSGEVVKIGEQVTKFRKGDLVFSRPSKVGTFAEYIAVHEDEVSIKPSNISFEEAASLPLVGLTTWQAFDSANLHAGQRVLIQAGAGGVGSFAIQLAKIRGAEVWTTTSEKNVEFVKSLGADHVIDYRKENPWDVIKGMDLVFDTLGGNDLYKIYPAVKKGGWIVSISGSPDRETAKDMELNAMKTFVLGMVGLKANLLAMARGIQYKFLFMKPHAQQLDQIRTLVEQGKIRPVIDSVYSLKDIQKGLEHSMAGRARGKIVVKITD